MAHWIKYEEEFEPAKCEDLLVHFNLSSYEQYLEIPFDDDTEYYIDEGIFIDEEQLQIVDDEHRIIRERQRKTTFYEDINVLVVTYEFYSYAYHIGKTIDNCKYLGDSLYSNYIDKIIQHYLDTGEHGFHLS